MPTNSRLCLTNARQPAWGVNRVPNRCARFSSLATTAVDSALSRVVHGPAPKRRKSGAEHHARVEQVGVGHDAFVQAGDGLVEQRQDQAIREFGIALWLRSDS